MFPVLVAATWQGVATLAVGVGKEESRRRVRLLENLQWLHIHLDMVDVLPCSSMLMDRLDWEIR